MESYLFRFDSIAATARTATIIMNMLSAQSATESGGSSVQAAMRHNQWVFAAYMLLLVLVAVFTYFLWKSGNRLQKAIRNDANARIEEAKNEAAQANRIAEKERLARVQLEVHLAARNLSIAQQREIADRISDFSGKTVALWTYSIDAEGARLGQQIKATLEAAGLHIEDSIGRVIPAGKAAIGVQITGPPEERDLVNAISEALATSGGLDVVSPPTPSLPDSSVVVLVGVKPFLLLKRSDGAN